MKQPLQALLIAPDNQMRQDILDETKQITIREGNRNYRTGAVMLTCHIEPWAVMADITYVYCTPLCNVPLKDILDDGFLNHDEALKGLQRFYPNMTMESDVTIIRWENVRGKLVDQQ